MVITFKKREQKQKYLILLFLVLIIAIFLVIYFGILNKQAVPPPPAFIYTPIKININFDALKNPFIKKLLPFEEIKPFEGAVGRENPFEPY